MFGDIYLNPRNIGIMLGSIDKKLLSHLRDFDLSVGGMGVWVNPLKKENSRRKSFFHMFNEVLKIYGKWYHVDVKANKSNKK